MTQGLFIASSGIRNNQVSIDVIANNIANVTTTAFKGSRANFSDIFLNSISAGSSPTQSLGGTNPVQRGIGAQLSEIVMNHNQGGSQFTGRSSDMMITGEGFFVAENVSAQASANQGTFFTRAGNFSVDSQGHLVTAEGNRLRGTSQLQGNSPINADNIKIPMSFKIAKFLDASNNVIGTALGAEASTLADFNAYATANGITAASTIVEDAELLNYSFSPSGAVSASYSNGDRLTVRANPDTTTNRTELIHITEEGETFAGVNATDADGRTGQLSGALQVIATNPAGGNPMEGMTLQMMTATFVNKQGLEAISGNGFIPGPNSGDVQYGVPGSGGRGGIQTGALESSNIDMATEFSNLVISQRALEANSRMIRAQSEVLQSIINAVN